MYAVASTGRTILLAAAAEAGLDLVPPEGAFYGFVRLPEGRWKGSMKFAEQLLDEQRVVAIPGVAFGQSGERWLRISWVAPPDQVAEGLRRIAVLLKER
jgi:aspartate/methionine/tyrosine aminotransferase